MTVFRQMKLSMGPGIKLRKIMSDATIEQLRKKVDNVRPHDDFSAWTQAIQNASILQLDPKEPWVDDGTLIQVRRMCEEDVDLNKYFHRDADDEYGDYLDVPTLTGEPPLHLSFCSFVQMSMHFSSVLDNENGVF